MSKTRRIGSNLYHCECDMEGLDLNSLSVVNIQVQKMLAFKVNSTVRSVLKPF